MPPAAYVVASQYRLESLVSTSSARVSSPDSRIAPELELGVGEDHAALLGHRGSPS